MNETFSYIAISAIFLAGLVPVVIGIFYYIKENKRLDEQARKKGRYPTA